MQLYNYRKKRKRKIHSFDTGYYRYPRKRTKSHHSKRKRGAQKKFFRILGVVACVLVVLVAAGAGTYTYLRSAGRKSLMEAANSQAPDMGDHQDESGLVSRNGKKYKYNDEMITILCMGIDRDTALEEEGASGENGQADTIFLLALDPSEKNIKMLGISRDTMTAIRTYDHQGNYVGETVNHLGLAFSYGDGQQSSGELMTDAVSNLLYELPIHGYAAVNMNAIEKLNDSVDGVAVTLAEDMKLAGSDFKKGERVRLTGEQAESYVRYRDMDKEGSNSLRMQRQKQYALSFMNEAKSAIRRDVMLVVDLYQNLTEDMSTSIKVDEAVYLASMLPDMSFDMEDIRMLEGDTKQGAVYEEFYADEEALLNTVLEIFYTEVGE